MVVSDYLNIEKIGESNKATFCCDTFDIGEATCIYTQDGGDEYSECAITGLDNPNPKEAEFWFKVNDDTPNGRRRFGRLFNEIYNGLATDNVEYVETLMENSAIEFRLSHNVLFLWLNADTCRALTTIHRNAQMIDR